MFILNKSQRPVADVVIKIVPNEGADTSINGMQFVQNAFNFLVNKAMTHQQIEKTIWEQIKYVCSVYNIKKTPYTVNFTFNKEKFESGLRPMFNIVKNKSRKSVDYGYIIYIYFLNPSDFKVLRQEKDNFVAEFKQSAIYKKDKNFMYKIFGKDEIYYVDGLREAELINQEDGSKFEKIRVVRAGGKVYEVASEIEPRKIDLNKFKGLFVFENKDDVPANLKCKEYKLSNGKSVYSNENINKLKDGVHIGKGSYDDLAIVVATSTSFVASTRDVILVVGKSEIKLVSEKFNLFNKSL